MTGQPWEPDDNKLPEGLDIWAHPLDDVVVIKDAQDHLWVTIHNRASGDPAEWPTEITRRIGVALGIYPKEIADLVVLPPEDAE